ncbi:hypothetical protein ACJZ2D_016419 [Fusarium nematophilum]
MPLYTSQQPARLEVVQFGNWIKEQLFLETSENQASVMPILTPRESPLITERLLQGKVDIDAAYRQRLELGHEFYLGVKQHLMAILQVWDAIIDEKDAFDKLGRLVWDRQFIESFLLCTDTIPVRVNIGSLGPPGLPRNAAALAPTNMVHPPLLGAGNKDGPDSLQSHDTHDVLPPLTPYLAPMFPEEPEEWHTDLQHLVNETRDTMKSEISDFEEFTTPREQRTSTPVDLCALADDPRALNTREMGTQPVIGRQQRCEPDNPTSKKRRLDKISGCESKTQDEGHLRSKRRRR